MEKRRRGLRLFVGEGVGTKLNLTVLWVGALFKEATYAMVDG